MSNNKNKTEYITKSHVIERGWTERLIKKFLGEPDATRPNPMYKCASPMKLYDKKRVQRIERRKSFKEEMESTTKRKDSAQKAVSTKIEKALSYANTVEIEIPVMNYNDVINQACRSYNDWHSERCARNGEFFEYADPRTSDSDFLKRITINYLRHECSDYEQQLYSIYGKTGVQEAHDILQKRINDEIKRIYPQLN